MTRYILHGGGIRTSADEGKALFMDMVEGLGSEAKLLLCFFAQPKEVWQEKYAEWRFRIAVNVPKVSVTFGLATIEEFAGQSKDYDGLFLYGGNSRKLIESFKDLGDFETLIERFKVVAGSSAGAIMLSQTAWDTDERKIVEGLNFVPAKVLVHYKSKSYAKDDRRGPIDWQAAYDEIADYGENKLPIFALAEGEFEAFE